MKQTQIASVVLAASLSTSSAAVLINFDAGAASAGNGALFSDPTGVAAPAGVTVAPQAGALTTSGVGRALAFNGSTFATTITDISTITDNAGVGISGFTNYRVRYNSANDAYGFLENGGRLGKANAAFDGQAFANSTEFVLVSDSYATTINAGDTINYSYVAGSDSGATTLRTFLLFDGTTSVEVTGGSFDGTAAEDFGTISGNLVAPSGASSLGIYIYADGANGQRTLIDDVFLETVPVPEPSSTLLIALGGALGLIRRRR